MQCTGWCQKKDVLCYNRICFILVKMYYVIIDFKMEQSLGELKNNYKYNVVAVTKLSIEIIIQKKKNIFWGLYILKVDQSRQTNNIMIWVSLIYCDSILRTSHVPSYDWHVCILWVGFRIYIWSSCSVCQVWDQCARFVFQNFKIFLEVPLLPRSLPFGSHSSETSLLGDGFFHTLLISARRLFAWCFLMPREAVPVRWLHPKYFIFCDILCSMRRTPLSSYIPRGWSLLYGHRSVRISFCSKMLSLEVLPSLWTVQ